MKPRTVAMTAAEFEAARELLGDSESELAAELGVTPHVVHAWATGAMPIPKRYAQEMAWRAALMARQKALESSGLPECPWIAAHEAEPMPDDDKGILQHVKDTEAHVAACAICAARERYVEEHCGPLPPMPETILPRFVRWMERIPSWARPAVVGALVLAAIVSLRLVFALPTLFRSPGQLGPLLLAIVAAAGAGAAGGLAYTITRPTLRKLGLAGAYLTGIVCVFAYMGSFMLVAPIAFGEPILEGPDALWIFVAVSLFFGLVMGHSWFRDPDVM